MQMHPQITFMFIHVCRDGFSQKVIFAVFCINAPVNQTQLMDNKMNASVIGKKPILNVLFCCHSDVLNQKTTMKDVMF
jgi:hypothetical protein